jgi:glycosyltransferase involved in cell wall biosynthesis
LKSQAAELDNVEFRGYLEETEKFQLLRSAKALVFAAQGESFGMVPIEAFASGTPVIGINSGYTKHQIRDGKNGILYERGVENLAHAIEEFERDGIEASAAELKSKAEEYSTEKFRKRIRTLVEDVVQSKSV